MERIYDNGRVHEGVRGPMRLTITEALDAVAPKLLVGERRAHVVTGLEKQGRSGFGWFDFMVHRASDEG